MCRGSTPGGVSPRIRAKHHDVLAPSSGRSFPPPCLWMHEWRLFLYLVNKQCWTYSSSPGEGRTLLRREGVDGAHGRNGGDRHLACETIRKRHASRLARRAASWTSQPLDCSSGKIRQLRRTEKPRTVNGCTPSASVQKCAHILNLRHWEPEWPNPHILKMWVRPLWLRRWESASTRVA